MNRIMQPERRGGHRRIVRRRQDRQFGDEEPDQRRLQGRRSIPIHPKAAEILGRKAYKSVKDVPGDIDVAVFAIPAKFVAQALVEVRREEDSRRRSDSVGLRRDRQRRRAGGDRRDRPQVQRPPDGAQHLRLLLHADESLRHVLHRLRRQGQGRAVLAVGRHRHGDHRLLAAPPRWASRRSSASATSATSTRMTCSRSSSRTTTPRSSRSIART